MNREERAKKIIKILKREIPEAKCHLIYKNPDQLLFATILSAQTRDERVNAATDIIFEKYKNPKQLSNADIKWLEKILKPVGMFRTKSRRIVEAAKYILLNYVGKVPDNMEDMLKIPGVGRKTANLVLSEIFNTPGIIVDTHVKRVTSRLGFVKKEDSPEIIEKKLNKIVIKKNWTLFSFLIGDHGRITCKARKPQCDDCSLHKFCCNIKRFDDCI